MTKKLDYPLMASVNMVVLQLTHDDSAMPTSELLYQAEQERMMETIIERAEAVGVDVSLLKIWGDEATEAFNEVWGRWANAVDVRRHYGTQYESNGWLIVAMMIADQLRTAAGDDVVVA